MMARRRELKGIANALNSSFVSRNNDFHGYWSLGLLKHFALRDGGTSVDLSFPLPQPEASDKLIHFLVRHYTNMLTNLLNRQRIPHEWVSNVSITLDFRPQIKDAALIEGAASIEPFACHCKITDDRGRHFASTLYGRCWMHSAKKESRSTRYRDK
jgi:hypothetical protein